MIVTNTKIWILNRKRGVDRTKTTTLKNVWCP